MISLTNQTILLVDDNLINLIIGERMLTKAGAKVIKASGGMEALEILEKEPAINLVLLDLEMPDPDGFTTAQLIRNSGHDYAKVLVIALSAAEDAQTKKRATEAGIAYFLNKPIQTEALLALLTTQNQSSSAKSMVSGKENTLYDLDYLEMVTGGDPETMQTLAGHILDSSPLLIQEALEANRKNDPKNTASILHKLKGQLGIFTMTSLIESISDIEYKCGKTEIDAQIIESQIMRLKKEVDPAFEEIKQKITTKRKEV